MARRMRDEAFRIEQEKGRYGPRVRAINEMMDALRDRDGHGWMPHVAPWHGGVEARVLSILRDPGPKTQDGVGSGFLCVENDDPTAELQAQIEGAGIAPRDVTPWNAYPWYINRSPKGPSSRPASPGLRFPGEARPRPAASTEQMVQAAVGGPCRQGLQCRWRGQRRRGQRAPDAVTGTGKRFSRVRWRLVRHGSMSDRMCLNHGGFVGIGGAAEQVDAQCPASVVRSVGPQEDHDEPQLSGGAGAGGVRGHFW